MFLSLITEPSNLQKALTFDGNKTLTKNEFWLENKNNFPNILNLCLHLTNIPASLAYTERFFSICGVVCKQRSGNSSEDLLITRAFLKCNIDVLKKI